ncbi:MAG: beta-N-acetylhexosaminidase [Planctomycetota bacterium]
MSQDAVDLRALEPLLVPAPRRLELTGGWGAPQPWTESIEPGLTPEAYRLRVGEHGSEVVASGRSGLLRGRATLIQLERQYGSRCPQLVIEDAPATPHRGVMLDVSRDRVPTPEFLKHFADRCAGLKANHLELYTEHTFAYEGHAAVWRDASPLTPTDIQSLDQFCSERELLLGANQNTLGHFERWLSHPDYAPLAETHEAFEFDGIELQGPFSLCPDDPRSMELVRDLLDQLLPNFTSGRVNIGGDEALDIGQGRSAERVAREGRFEVFRAHLEAVADHARGQGFRPAFWADLALLHPERLEELPEDLLPLVWGYEAESPLRSQCEALAATGRVPWVCPGTSAWRSFTGRTAERRANLQAALDALTCGAARGLLITEWGDLGHRQVDAVGALAQAEALARAWNPDAEVDSRAIALHVFEDRSLQVALWLERLGDVDRALREDSLRRAQGAGRRGLANATALFEELHPSGFDFPLHPDADAWAAVGERLDDLAAERPRELELRLEAELLLALDQARFAAALGRWRRAGCEARHGQHLERCRERLLESQRETWDRVSRPGGLERALDYWRAPSVFRRTL